MLRIGLTGGIGSGKSTVARRFAELGIAVIDTDAIAHELVRPGQASLEEIVGAFGREMLDPDGRLDRARLRERVFHDRQARHTLEAILHPRIRAEMERQIDLSDGPYCIAVVPLLVETDQSQNFDRILVVTAPAEIRRERAGQRSGLAPGLVDAIMASQAGDDTRLAAADDVIENSGSLAALYRQVDALDRRYRRLAGETA